MNPVAAAIQTLALADSIGAGALDPPGQCASQQQETNKHRQPTVEPLPDGHFHGRVWKRLKAESGRQEGKPDFSFRPSQFLMIPKLGRLLDMK
jgi:hypothetical protein